MCSIPGSGRFLGGGNDNPLQYPCLEIPWTEEHSTAVHRVAKSRTRLKRLSTQATLKGPVKMTFLPQWPPLCLISQMAWKRPKAFLELDKGQLSLGYILSGFHEMFLCGYS